jgi:glycerol-3-phosphate dehydrogenase (NAD(P)+)
MAAASITVLGAGSWGTALAILLARNGNDTLLWGHRPERIAAIKKSKRNDCYLPRIALPMNLKVSADLAASVANRQIVLLAVPSPAFRDVLTRLRPHLGTQTAIAWATKGFDPDSGQLLHELVASVLEHNPQTAVISGPTFALEVAANLPTAVTVASASAALAERLAGLLHNPRFRAYTSDDIIGVEAGGAIKNVLAIATGVADGLGFGANTRAALITRGLAEMMRLGRALGGKHETFMGLAGLGDLVLTCTDDQSRNRRLGLGLGRGQSLKQTVIQIGQEIEGIETARAAYRLAQTHRIEMPIAEQVHGILYRCLSPNQAVHNLLAREQKAETEV